MAQPRQRLVGQRTPRVEDRDLVRGRGRFVGDIHVDGMLHAAFARSPYAHARINRIEKGRALAVPGARAVIVRDDILPHVVTDRLVVALPDRNYRQQCDRPILAGEEAIYVGEPVAIVVADDPYVAEDALAELEIDYEPLPAVADCRDALAPGAPTVHLSSKHNLVAEFVSSYGDVDAAFARAAHLFKDSFWQHRGCAASMEGRGCVAIPDQVERTLTLWSSTQTPLVGARLLAEILGRPEDSVRVAAPDVGGAFGPKLVFYSEEAAVLIAASILRVPVKWIEDRREHFISTTQERDEYWDAEIALDNDGKILAVRGTLLHDHGAYTARGLTVPQGAVAALTLSYVVPAYRIEAKVVLTNKVPVTPVRGAGQPQGVFVMERLLDRAARELGIDRAEIRRRNLVPQQSMPFKKDFVTRGGFPIVLDSGDYQGCQADALAAVGWMNFRLRQQQARAQGRYIGLGIGNYVEGTGRGPFEQVSVRVAPSGTIYVTTGATPMGQGTRTMLSQIVADQLGGRLDRVHITAGDSSKVAMGFGGFNSRQTVMAGSSAHAAAIKVREKLLRVASHLLEADEADLDIEGDDVVVKGTSHKVSLAAVAKSMAGTPGYSLPGQLQPGIEASESVVIDPMTYANGTAAAEVEVDVDTGKVRVNRVVFAHDAGTLINPMLVDGQIVGGVVHGIGNALFEWMGFDDHAQPLTTTFADYLLMTADQVPEFQIIHRNSPSPLNALGVKGVGEAGVIPMPAAIASAVEDALSPFGVRINRVPIRPKDLAALIASARNQA